jgi:hypothetical protein
MRHEDIAIALGISRPTLDKHYAAELSEGALSRRVEVMQALHAAAKRGNSGAAKAYLLMEPQLAAPPLPAPEKQAKPEAVGKKQQAAADAITAARGTDWDNLLTTAQAAPLQ